MRKLGFLASEAKDISKDISKDVPSDVFDSVSSDISKDTFEDISNDVTGGIWCRLILACVPVVYRHSAVCVCGCIGILVKASAALRPVVLGIPKKLGAVYGLCSRKVFHWVYVMYGSVRHFFQVGHKALRDSFVDNPEYDAFSI